MLIKYLLEPKTFSNPYLFSTTSLILPFVLSILPYFFICKNETKTYFVTIFTVVCQFKIRICDLN